MILFSRYPVRRRHSAQTVSAVWASTLECQLVDIYLHRDGLCMRSRVATTSIFRPRALPSGVLYDHWLESLFSFPTGLVRAFGVLTALDLEGKYSLVEDNLGMVMT
jgi:hypothetical protein